MHNDYQMRLNSLRLNLQAAVKKEKVEGHTKVDVRAKRAC